MFITPLGELLQREEFIQSSRQPLLTIFNKNTDKDSDEPPAPSLRSAGSAHARSVKWSVELSGLRAPGPIYYRVGSCVKYGRLRRVRELSRRRALRSKKRRCGIWMRGIKPRTSSERRNLPLLAVFHHVR
jgi:hypothetical protein